MGQSCRVWWSALHIWFHFSCITLGGGTIIPIHLFVCLFIVNNLGNVCLRVCFSRAHNVVGSRAGIQAQLCLLLKSVLLILNLSTPKTTVHPEAWVLYAICASAPMLTSDGCDFSRQGLLWVTSWEKILKGAHRGQKSQLLEMMLSGPERYHSTL